MKVGSVARNVKNVVYSMEKFFGTSSYCYDCFDKLIAKFIAHYIKQDHEPKCSNVEVVSWITFCVRGKKQDFEFVELL